MKPTNYNTILYKEHQFFTTISLNRPEKRNAFNAEMIQEITSAVHKAIQLSTNRAIVFQGEGKSFSAGADLTYMQSMASFSEKENEEDSKLLYDLFHTIYNSPIPTICYVHGASFGGANGIIAACDYCFAEKNTLFSFSEVKIGLVPATISPFVLKKIGEPHALDLFLTGRRFSALEAKEAGLIHQIIEKENAKQAIKDYVNHYANAAPQAVKITKQLIRAINQQTNQRDYTAALIAKARVSKEGQEGISAFFEKRHPNWIQQTNYDKANK